MEEVFKVFDVDGNGTISRSELDQVMQELDPVVWTEDNVGRLFAKIDVNKDDVLNYAEFLAWIGLDGDDQLAVCAAGAKVKASPATTLLSLRQKLETMLLCKPSDELRTNVVMFAIQMKESGVAQRQAASILSFTHSVWSAKCLGEQDARLELLNDAISIVAGFEDNPSPLYCTSLLQVEKAEEIHKVEKAEEASTEFQTAVLRAQAYVSQKPGDALTALESQRDAMQAELDTLLREKMAEEEKSAQIKTHVGATMVVTEIESAAKRNRRKEQLRLESMRDDVEDWLAKQKYILSTEAEFAAFAASEALLAEESRHAG